MRRRRRTAFRSREGSELIDGYQVSSNVFSTIVAPFALGHGFAADANEPGQTDVAVLSYGFWMKRLGGSRGILDSVITLGGKPHRVVGVLADHVVFPMRADVYAPFATSGMDRNDYGSRYLDIFARLAPGATIESARREAEVISRQLALESPKTDVDWMLVPRPLKSYHTDDVQTLQRISSVAVILVLLAACVSVANLALARAASRRHELTLRAALGGRRGRIVRHLLVEALVIAVVGGALGVALAAVGVSAMRDAIPASLASFVPGWELVRVDGRAVVFTVGVSFVAALVFASLPALRATRVDLASVLSDGGRSSSGGVYGTRLRATFVVFEVSVALVLLTGATLLGRSVRNMLAGDPGVRLDHVLVMHVSVPRSIPDSTVRGLIDRLDVDLHAQPGILGAGFSSTTPLSNNWWGTTFDIPGRAPNPAGHRLTANDQRITPDYFRTAGVRLLSGRGIDRSDDAGTQRVVVINRYMSDQLWPGLNPIGRVVLIDSLPWSIVGVAADVRHGGFDEPLQNIIYRSMRQATLRNADLAVWTSGDPNGMRDVVRRIVTLADPDAAVGDMMSMREVEARHVSAFKMNAATLTTFAAVTMVIAVVGLYGVIAYGVAQRTREIGVRLALGAQRRDILANVVGTAVRLTIAGIVLGGAGAFAFAQLLTSMLYGVTPGDPRTPLGVAAVLLGVALAAAFIPAWRAARVNPVIALRD